LEDFRSKENLLKKVQEKINQKLPIDIAKMAWRGDTASASPIYSYFDGFRKLSNVNVIDAGNNVLTIEMLQTAIDTLNIKYRVPELAFIMDYKMKSDYIRLVSKRETGTGDAYLLNNVTPTVEGIRILDAPYLGSYQNGGSTNSEILLTIPQNFIIVMKRDLKFEMERNMREKRWDIMVSSRWITMVEDTNAVVKITNIKHKTA
jgi:hypothetical protein